jgi:hypothetical protein
MDTLVVHPPRRDTLLLQRNDQQANPTVLLTTGPHSSRTEITPYAVCDPLLIPIHDIFVPLPHGRGLDISHITPTILLRYASAPSCRIVRWVGILYRSLHRVPTSVHTIQVC